MEWLDPRVKGTEVQLLDLDNIFHLSSNIGFTFPPSSFTLDTFKIQELKIRRLGRERRAGAGKSR